MNKASEFAQILEKIQNQSQTQQGHSQTMANQSKNHKSSEMAHNTELQILNTFLRIGKLTPFQFSMPKTASENTISKFTLRAKTRPSPDSTPLKTGQNDASAASQAIPRTKHKFTPDQEQALLSLNSFEGNLRADFTRRELKQCYRRLAIKYHPDHTHGQKPELFIRVHSAYSILILLFADNQ